MAHDPEAVDKEKQDAQSGKKSSEIETSAIDIGEEESAPDPFTPFPANALLPEERNPLTLRAVLLGWLFGGLVNASNIYLGLKSGFAQDASMFATLFGYLALIGLFRAGIPLLRGPYGPREHNIIQTVATATGGLSTLFFGAVPAMYQLGLLSDSPQKDYWKLVTLTASGAFFGSAIAIPFRKFFIVEAARELGMVFPTATAVATIIRDLHLGGKDQDASRSARVLGITLAVCMVWVVATSYAKGILFDWNITWWIYQWSGYTNGAIYAFNWGFFTIEWTPAFLGFGTLVGLNVAGSWMLGYVVAFGIIGPILVAKGVAVGIAYNPEYPKLVTYFATASPDPVNAPSPRYWLMWPAVSVMLVAALTDIACHWRLIARSLATLRRSVVKSGMRVLEKRGMVREGGLLHNLATSPTSSDASRDPHPREHQVMTWEWMAASLLAAIFAGAVLGGYWKINVGIVVLVLVMGTMLATLAVICTGQAAMSPLGVISSSSQLVIGGILRSDAGPLNHRMLSSMVSGTVATTAATQITEMSTDFKIGFYLGTPPRIQWFAQMLGCLPAIFLSPGLCILFLRAYPCIIDPTAAATCPFAAPSVATYTTIVTGVLSPTFPVARSSWIFAILASVVTVAVHYLRFWTQRKGYTRVRAFIPNMLMMGLGVMVPSFSLPFAVLMGCAAASIWKHRSPHSHAALLFPIAAGMIAGESIGGVINSILTIANVSGPTYYGTNIGCPAGHC